MFNRDEYFEKDDNGNLPNVSYRHNGFFNSQISKGKATYTPQQK